MLLHVCPNPLSVQHQERLRRIVWTLGDDDVHDKFISRDKCPALQGMLMKEEVMHALKGGKWVISESSPQFCSRVPISSSAFASYSVKVLTSLEKVPLPRWLPWILPVTFVCQRERGPCEPVTLRHSSSQAQWRKVGTDDGGDGAAAKGGPSSG